MKRIISLLTAVVLTLALLGSCAAPAAPLTASELLDLGEKYLLELDYEQAIVQFLAVIEVEPMNARGYTGAAEAYIALGDTAAAVNVLQNGLSALPDNPELMGLLDAVQSSLERGTERDAAEQEAWRLEVIEELTPIIEALDIPFTVDNITLGVSGIEEAKSAYSGRPYALSNLMNDGADDSVYTFFGGNGMPIPEGYHERQFGFLFVASVSDTVIHSIQICDPSFVCLGSLRVGDEGKSVLRAFGLEAAEYPEGETVCETASGKRFTLNRENEDEFDVSYSTNAGEVRIRVRNGGIYSIYFNTRGTNS